MIAPGATLGVLGGGQLGRMFAQAAHSLGYDVAVLDPDPDSPAGRIAERHLCARYDDAGALQALAAQCAAVTTEFENVPAASLRALADTRPVCPAAGAVEIAQDRNREKAFFAAAGVASVASAILREPGDLEAGARSTGFPAVLKTARLGYDGKGQARVADLSAARAAFAELGGVECILERQVALACELSVVLARRGGGECVVLPVVENRHRDGILDTTIAPAQVGGDIAAAAVAASRRLAEELDYRGVLAVEFFVTESGELLANEMAPRPHNSGHYSIDACTASQFELQVRTLCELPLAEPRLHTPAVMVNLLGDLWRDGAAPDFARVLRLPGCRLHLYGKRDARPGRKMGHLTCLGADTAAALALAERARAELAPP